MKETQLRRENQSPLIRNFPYNTFHVLFSLRLLSCFNEYCLIIGNEVIAPYFMTQEAVVIETSSSIVSGFPYLVDTSFAISYRSKLGSWLYEVCVPMTTRLRIGSRRYSEKCRKYAIALKWIILPPEVTGWFRGVTVSTWDSESQNPSSNLGGTFLLLYFFLTIEVKSRVPFSALFIDYAQMH